MSEDQTCSKCCNRKEHGDFMVAALTKRAVSDIELASFLNYTCILCGTSKDVHGRSALHMAASCGRTDVCKWLVCQKQGKIDDKDLESGYTALHRSVFYGKIDTAVALIQLGGHLKILDSNDLTPLDHAQQDISFLQALTSLPASCQHYTKSDLLIYVWGPNTNYTLGPNHARHNPDILDSFHRTFPDDRPVKIFLEKFHTVILSQNGLVYTFGHGQGGRLGIGIEQTVLEPTLVKFPSKGISGEREVKHCAIARDHCVFVTSGFEVWTCGLNTYHVLGLVPPPPQALTPQQVKIRPIENVACARYHTVAWTGKHVYTWGFNGGQLGHGQATTGSEQFITAPKLVTSLTLSENRRIISLAASNGATAVATDRGDIYILHEYQCRAIASNKLDIISVAIYGGKLATIDNKRREDLRVVALTRGGNIYVWQESDQQLCRCNFSFRRLLRVQELCLNAYGLVFLTDDREVFNGKFKARRRKTIQTGKKNFHNFLDRDDCVTVQVDKVGRIYGAASVTCDLDGHNFAALHLNTINFITLTPKISESTLVNDYASLLSANQVDSDVIFKVGSRLFPAHRFIVAESSEKLHKMMLDNIDNNPLAIPNIDVEIFQEIIDYIYTRQCSLVTQGPIPQHLAKFNRNLSKKQIKQVDGVADGDDGYKSEVSTDPVRLLRAAAKELGVMMLYHTLGFYAVVSGNIQLKTDSFYTSFIFYNADSFPEYFDVRIRATCGNHLNAHKCILSARCEFFMNMFSMRWASHNTATQSIDLPFELETLRHLVTYLYENRISLEKEDLDRIVNLLILADHILLDRLVEICEEALKAHITIKNVLRLLVLADVYNAPQLKAMCMEFVCLNLALMLETRHLEQINDALLKELTVFYGEWNTKMSHRVVTPFSDACSDDFIKAIHAKWPVKMNFDEIVKVEQQPKTQSHRRRNRTRLTSTNACDKNVIIEGNGKESENIPLRLELNDVKNLSLNEERISSTPVRINAICKAHQDISDIYDDDDYVSLISSSKEFPDLSSSFGETSQHKVNASNSSVSNGKTIKGKMTRLSQRERKRLTSASESSPPCKEDLPESTKNPWNMNVTASSVGKSPTFGNIITEERKQKENLSRIRSKLLIYTQMEDKALEELERFYNVGNVFDEIIQVRRVDLDCGPVGAPLWIHK